MRLACKIFDKEKAPHDFLDKFFPRELEILTKIENPHIIQVRVIRRMLISLSLIGKGATIPWKLSRCIPLSIFSFKIGQGRESFHQ